MTMSIVVCMGFINQTNLEFPEKGDEFDHVAPAAKADVPLELIIVDRAWPTRWKRIHQALESMIDRVKYIPPKPSKFINMGYRAVNAMRNSGAIVAAGDLFAFVDDFFWLDTKSIEASWKEFEESERILCPVYLENMLPPPDHIGDQEFSGHNPGIYMCTREQFKQLGGFNENFDGTYGEADTEWENRLDRLLDSTPEYELRYRRHSIIFRRTEHRNGKYPQRLRYPWKCNFPIRDPENLRCNRAFYHCICKRRLDSGIFDASLTITDEELELLKKHECFNGCGVCNRPDRDSQIQSYREFPIDTNVVDKIRKFYLMSDRLSGSFNPWGLNIWGWQ